jgi:hypothetical protein
MKKRSYWGLSAVMGLIIIGVIWWITNEVKDLKDPLNKSDAFVYSDNRTLYWFELASRKGKVDGRLHQQKYIEEDGKEQYMDDNIYPLTGNVTEKGYEFKVNISGENTTFDAWFSSPHLAVQKQGEKDNILYNPVDQEELDEYVKAIKLYDSEQKEKERLKKFFSDLDSVYGYLYYTENEAFQLFIKIDEALLEGELTGSLLMMVHMGDKNKPYEETRYVLNGVTDGHMVEVFTQVDGKETKLEGNFHEGATGFDLSFWTTNQKLSFHAVTEEEFKQIYEEFKTEKENE